MSYVFSLPPLRLLHSEPIKLANEQLFQHPFTCDILSHLIRVTLMPASSELLTITPEFQSTFSICQSNTMCSIYKLDSGRYLQACTFFGRWFLSFASSQTLIALKNKRQKVRHSNYQDKFSSISVLAFV